MSSFTVTFWGDYLQKCSIALLHDDFSQNKELTHFLKGNQNNLETVFLKEQSKIQEEQNIKILHCLRTWLSLEKQNKTQNKYESGRCINCAKLWAPYGNESRAWEDLLFLFKKLQILNYSESSREILLLSQQLLWYISTVIYLYSMPLSKVCWIFACL